MSRQELAAVVHFVCATSSDAPQIVNLHSACHPVRCSASGTGARIYQGILWLIRVRTNNVTKPHENNGLRLILRKALTISPMAWVETWLRQALCRGSASVICRHLTLCSYGCCRCYNVCWPHCASGHVIKIAELSQNISKHGWKLFSSMPGISTTIQTLWVLLQSSIWAAALSLESFKPYFFYILCSLIFVSSIRRQRRHHRLRLTTSKPFIDNPALLS